MEDPTHYNDDAVLTEYVLRHYDRYLTAAEGRGICKTPLTHKAAVELKCLYFDQHLDERYGPVTDQEIADALADGRDSLRIRTRDRLLREYSDTIVINRCPQCKRIVRSPMSKQCQWCKHKWHGTKGS